MGKVIQDADVLALLNALHGAMVDADTRTLGALLEPEYALTHITGYVQPKAEWLAVIRAGSFDYHRIELLPGWKAVQHSTDGVCVTGRGIFDATIQGCHAPWRLAFTLWLRPHDDRWLFTKAHYTTF